MGDRAIVEFLFAGSEEPLSLYLHWQGDTVREELANALWLTAGSWSNDMYLSRVLVSQLTVGHTILGSGLLVGRQRVLVDADTFTGRPNVLVVNLEDQCVTDLPRLQTHTFEAWCEKWGSGVRA